MKRSILKKLRETASACPNAGTSGALQNHANAIAVCMQRLAFSFKDEDLRELNGLWARAYVMMDAAQKPTTPTPPQTEVLKLEKMAA